MDEKRIADLSRNQKFLSNEAIRVIDKYRNYLENELPVVTVLCSNSNLMERIKKNEIESDTRHFLKTFCVLDDNETLEEDILFSDIVIIYTTALKIAPDSLFRAVKNAVSYKKKVYAILGGWNQIGRDETKIRAKIDELHNTFSEVNLVNVYAENARSEGMFLSLNDIFSKIAFGFENKFSAIRHEQEEIIYVHIAKLINQELAKCEKDILSELVKCNEFIEYVQKKHLSSQVVFKNAGADLKDISENVREKLFSGIPKNYQHYLGDDTEQIDLDDFILEVKKEIISNLDRLFESNGSENVNEDLKRKIDSLSDECVREVMSVVGGVQKLHYVSEDLLNKLKEAINTKQDFEEFVQAEENAFSGEMKTVKADIAESIEHLVVKTKEYKRIDRVKDALDVVDMGIDYYHEAKEKFKGYEKSESQADDAGGVENDDEYDEMDESENNFDGKSKMRRIDAKLDETQKSQLNKIIKTVCEEAEGLVFRKVDASIGNVHERTRSISVSYVDKYFNSVLAALQDIKMDLEHQRIACKG